MTFNNSFRSTNNIIILLHRHVSFLCSKRVATLTKEFLNNKYTIVDDFQLKLWTPTILRSWYGWEFLIYISFEQLGRKILIWHLPWWQGCQKVTRLSMNYLGIHYNKFFTFYHISVRIWPNASHCSDLLYSNVELSVFGHYCTLK